MVGSVDSVLCIVECVEGEERETRFQVGPMEQPLGLELYSRMQLGQSTGALA